MRRKRRGRLGVVEPNACCQGVVPRVLQVTSYDPKFWTRSVPSSDKRLGNHTQHTRHGPTPPGLRGRATNLKETNPGAMHIFMSPRRVKYKWT
jgi:hypothetical protein